MEATHIPGRIIGLLALGAMVGAAQAPSTGLHSDPDAPIVVTGTRLTREMARDRAVEFVRELEVASGRTPAARWIDPVCPAVRGIAAPYARIVETRMRAIAAAAGIKTGGEGCQPNISVSFVRDAGALVRDVASRSPRRLMEVQPGDREALLNGEAPVRWWYVTEQRGRGGMRNAARSIQTSSGPGAGPSLGGVGSLDTESLSQYSSSMVSTQVNRVLIDAAVVVDFDGASGHSLEAVAAYAAFVAFAEVRAAEATPRGSVLNMFAPDAFDDGLTDWDMAFLRALYGLQLDREAHQHRGLLVRDMVGFQTDE